MMIDFLRRLLFEDLPLLLLAQAVAMAVVLAVHRRWMTRRSRRLVWIGLALCAALVALQVFVVTDREALTQMVQTLARAVDQGDMDTIADKLDAGFITSLDENIIIEIYLGHYGVYLVKAVRPLTGYKER